MSASDEVQKAVYDALVAAGLTGVVSIRDRPNMAPGASDFPFVEIGNSQAIAADAGGDGGLDETVDLHVWSRSRGQKQVKDIMGEIRAALHLVDLTVTGRAIAHSIMETARVVDDDDGETVHGVITIRIYHRS